MMVVKLKHRFSKILKSALSLYSLYLRFLNVIYKEYKEVTKRKPNPYFRFRQFTVFHDKCAMKVGTDGVLLGAWLDVDNAVSALDIGTGTGLIALMMAQRNVDLQIDAIDIDADAIIQAKENIFDSPFASRITSDNVAIENFLSETKYDIIVSNPPFFINSLKSADKQRTLARHADSLSIECLISSSAKRLSKNGRISLIYPFEYKEELGRLAQENELYLSRVTNIYPTPQSEPKRILVELTKKGMETMETNLVIELDRHVYSDEFKKLTEKFYL